MKITKIVVLCLIPIFLISFGLASCKAAATTTTAAETTAATTTTAAETTAAEKQITITIWDHQVGDPYKNAFAELIPAYEKLHPNIKIERTAYNYADIEDKEKAAIQSNTLPDLFGLHKGPQVEEMSKAGLLFNWADVINADPEWKGWLGASLNMTGEYNQAGQMIGLPYDTFGCFAWGFSNVLESMKSSKAEVLSLKTIKDLADFAQKLKSEGYKKWWISTGLKGGTYLREFFYVFVFQQTQPVNKAYKAEFQQDGVKWTDKEFVVAAQAIKDFSKAFREDVMNLDYQTDHYGFLQNLDTWGSAMDGSWSTGVIASNPDAINNVFAFYLPACTEGAANNVLEADVGQMVGMKPDNPNKEEIIKFAKFLNSPDCTRYMLKNLITPAGKWSDDWQSLVKYPIFGEMQDLMQKSIISPWVTYTGEIQTSLINNLSQVFMGTLTPDQAMANVQADTEAYWKSQ
ncbi:MAG: extracellular solute-binding protein [Actinobacteria bacterium]|nr:extracellular solute-binding protein [Actinomycetota bacterium]